VLAREHARELGVVEARAQRVERALGLGDRVRVAGLARELQHHGRVVRQLVGLGEEVQGALELALLAQDLLGLLAVLPERGIAGGALQLLEPRGLRREVKDAS
jgi:hypothetical protein